MEKIHNNLKENFKGYASWHEHPHHKKIHWGTVIALTVLIGFIFMGAIQSWYNSYDTMVIEFSPRSAVLTLDPQTKTVKVGDTFIANILLDTAGKPVDGVDIYSLHFDPTILSVVDDSSAKTGVQIKPGTMMDVTAVNSVNPSTGTIKFSQAANPGSNFSGKGVLASIHFKAVRAGNTYLKFDFHLGNTKDTNVAHGGRDQLKNVVDAAYTVNAK